MSNNSVFDSIAISATGLSAERVRMNTIANNIANMHTTRTEEGGPYRRQYVIFEEVLNKASKNSDPLDSMGGVRISAIGKSNAEPIWVYKPDDPDAMKEGPHAGHVAMPNINPVSEMVDMITAQRAYEANVQAIASARSIIAKALEIGK
jgi:flagellar basal-body rod protein FlgC